jgi:hypothetical protein
MLAARGIVVSHETVRQWALKFGQVFWEATTGLPSLIAAVASRKRCCTNFEIMLHRF